MAPELRTDAGMRASGTAIPHVELASQQRSWYSASAAQGFSSMLSELGIPSAHRHSISTGAAATTGATAKTAAATAAQAQGSSSTAQSATDSVASESSASETTYNYVAPVSDGITLGPNGSALSPEQAAANHAAQLASWNQESAAAAAARDLTISDYLAPGDSLSNYPAGTTIAQLIQGYSCTVPNMADPNAGEYPATGEVMVNGAAITGLVPDPYGGPAAPIGSTAAAMFIAEGVDQKGGLPPSLEA